MRPRALRLFFPVPLDSASNVLRGRRMKRRTPAVIAILVALGISALSWVEGEREAARQRAETRARDAEFAAAKEKESSAEGDESATDEASASASPELPKAENPLPSAQRFNTLPDGSPVPALATDAPSRVKVGLSIFRYRGAQAPPASERSREAALQLARKAAQKAVEDFDAAVEMGDQGSDANVGWMKRGILEPAVEYAVFSLKQGQVSESPIDTPRGFWVVKRIR